MKTSSQVAVAGPTPLILPRVTDDASVAAVLAEMRRASGQDVANTWARFPGPNPVSLDRSHFGALRRQPYYVCEKTDGVRHALVCCRLPAPTERGFHNVCALVNRAMAVYLLPIQRLPRAAYQGTVLDGEVAWNREAGAWEYVAFDAPCVSGVPVRNEPLVERMGALHCIMKVYRGTGGVHERDPLALVPKAFYSSIKDYEAALPALTRRYEVDGLILTPANPGCVYGQHAELFKLKTKHTVDFLVVQGDLLAVYDPRAQGGNGHTVVGRLEPHDRTQIPPQPGAIVECSAASQPGSFCAAGPFPPPGGREQLGIWRLLGVRTDKTTANNMTTYTKTLLNIVENLTLDDLRTIFVKP